MDRVHYTVSSLGNSVNKTQIKNALEKLQGVQEVCVDLGRNTIEVMFNEKTSEEEIRNSIEDTGFNIEA